MNVYCVETRHLNFVRRGSEDSHVTVHARADRALSDGNSREALRNRRQQRLSASN
jgi:hypothetical protein